MNHLQSNSFSKNTLKLHLLLNIQNHLLQIWSLLVILKWFVTLLPFFFCCSHSIFNKGKTSFILTFLNNDFPCSSLPIVFDNAEIKYTISSYTTMLGERDTMGLSDYCLLRRLSYTGADIFIACYTVVNRKSFYHIEESWYGFEFQFFLN